MSKNTYFSGKTAIITGGSKGIGKAIAKEIVKLGGNVCIIARNLSTLKKAAEEMKECIIKDDQIIEIISSDTSNMKKLKPLLTKFIKKNGTPDFLINCVGYAYPQYIQKLELEDFKKNMEINYYGQLIPILILLPYFMKEKKGYIANCSSGLGFMGMMGYATYSPTKFAIVGLSEALRHELKPYNINVSILYPPDTDTPGFEKENETKPKEVAIMSEVGGLMSAEQVADTFIKGIMKKKFHILPGQCNMLWKIVRHFPKLSLWILDNEYKKAVKKMGNNL